MMAGNVYVFILQRELWEEEHTENVTPISSSAQWNAEKKKSSLVGSLEWEKSARVGLCDLSYREWHFAISLPYAPMLTKPKAIYLKFRNWKQLSGTKKARMGLDAGVTFLAVVDCILSLLARYVQCELKNVQANTKGSHKTSLFNSTSSGFWGKINFHTRTLQQMSSMWLSGGQSEVHVLLDHTKWYPLMTTTSAERLGILPI